MDYTEKTLQEALDNLITYTDEKQSITQEEYNSLGLNGYKDSSSKREILSKHFHTGKCNSKTMFKRLNMLGITYKQISEIL